MSDQPSGLGTPEACENISPGYAFFAYPGFAFRSKNRTPKVVRGAVLIDAPFHPGVPHKRSRLISNQPSGLCTPEACENTSPRIRVLHIPGILTTPWLARGGTEGAVHAHAAVLLRDSSYVREEDR